MWQEDGSPWLRAAGLPLLLLLRLPTHGAQHRHAAALVGEARDRRPRDKLVAPLPGVERRVPRTRRLQEAHHAVRVGDLPENAQQRGPAALTSDGTHVPVKVSPNLGGWYLFFYLLSLLF